MIIAGYDTADVMDSDINNEDMDMDYGEDDAEIENSSGFKKQYGNLEISEHVSNDDQSITTYEAIVTGEATNLRDYERMFSRIIHPSLLKFCIALVNHRSEGAKIWCQFNIKFERVDADGETETMFVPFRMASISIDKDREEVISSMLRKGLSQLVESITNLTQSGSGWIYAKLENMLLNVAYNPDAQFNGIGTNYSGRVNIERRYGKKNKSAHLNSKNRNPLNKYHQSLCSDVDDCMIIAVGVATLNLKISDLLKMNKMAEDEFWRFRQNIMSAAYQYYDCRSLSSLPVTFAQLSQFMIDNQEILCVNIYGYNKLPSKTTKYKIFPFMVGENQAAPKVMNLLITKRIENSSSPASFHISTIFDFHGMLSVCDSSCSSTRRFFCNRCLSSFSLNTDLEKHTASRLCETNRPQLIFPDREERLAFTVGRKKYPTSAVISWDMETGPQQSSAENGESFGPMTTSVKKLVPLSLGFMTKFMLHPEAYPLLLPKVILGEECIDEFFGL